VALSILFGQDNARIKVGEMARATGPLPPKGMNERTHD
jgi:hypothetical protein